MSRAILITGATGKQGGALINALLASPNSSEITLLAVTRNVESAGAQKLAARGVKLVQGNLNDVPAIFTSALQTNSSIWGVYSVQVSLGERGANPVTEEAQGKALVDEALKHGVKHFVYSSVDRGGEAKSWEDPTYVPHFTSKHNVERYLRDRSTAEGASMSWTILRPVAFFEGFEKGMMGSVFGATLKLSLKGRPLQFIAVKDIGRFAAQAFLEPEKYAGKAVGLAGDKLTFAQLKEVFERKTGETFPEGHWIFGWLLTWLVKEVGLMVKWFHDVGFGIDVQDLRKEYPQLQDFGAWLEKDSPWKEEVGRRS